MQATAHDDNDSHYDHHNAEIPGLIEDREAPFHMDGDFGMARYNAETDRFTPVVFLWLEPDHVEKPTENTPVFVTNKEAIAWIRGQAGWLEIRHDPNAPESKYETSFCVHTSSLVKVEAKCGDLGLQLTTSEVSYETVLSAWGMQDRDRHQWDAWDRLVERATKAAQDYIRVHIRAPKADKQVVAVAKQECGMPVFHTLEGHDTAFWTSERIASIDFHRCDQCNIKHHRTKLFLVRNAAGEIEQYGGACAKHLNLAKLVNHHLRALKALQTFMGGFGSDEEWGFGGRSKEAERVDPRFALIVADMMISEHGYISGSKAYHSNGEITSTKSHVLGAMSLLLGWTKLKSKDSALKEEKARLQEKLSEYPEDRAQALYEKGEALVEEKLSAELTEFTNNLNVAFRTGSLKLLGFLVWLPSLIRKVDAAEARRKVEAIQVPWTPSAAERPTTGAELSAFLETYYDGNSQRFCDELTVKEAALKRALDKPEKALTQALQKKIFRTVPGTWTVTYSRNWTGDYGTTFFLTLVRHDGAKVMWKTGSPVTDDGMSVNEGDHIVFKGASVGDIPALYTNPKNGKTSQDGRLVNRVSCVLIHPDAKGL